MTHEIKRLPLHRTLTKLFSMHFILEIFYHFEVILAYFPNPWMDWHTRSFHFETLKHKTSKCEAFTISMYSENHNHVYCCAPKNKHEDEHMQNFM
jgi:hypothetical protein